MNIYLQNIKKVFLRLIVLLILFQFTRLFFYWNNISTFDNNSFNDTLLMFFYGTRFDLSSLAFANIILILFWFIPGNFKFNRIYQNIVKLLFVIVNSIFLLSNLVDSEYFKFTKKRSTFYIFEMLGFGNTKADGARQIPQFITEYWYIFVIWIFIILILIFAHFNLSNFEKKTKYSLKIFFIEIITLIFIIGIFIIFSRGGLQLKPIKDMNTAEYFGTEYSPLISNTPFSIIKSIDKIQLQEKHYFANTDTNKFNNTLKNYKRDNAFDKKNVIIIILESFSKEYIGALTGKKTYTPFLDSLIKNSLCFSSAYANGTQSVQAVPSIIAGIPSLSESPFVSSIYITNNFKSITQILNNEDYFTSFFHGGHKGSMGFGTFAKLTACNSIFELPEYNNRNDYDGRWGIFDEPFLQFVATKMNTFKQPFFSYIFTLSSHHPYTVPEKYKKRFTDGQIPIQKTISYADFALKRFFKTAEKMPWYNNTLFVLVADHTGPVATKAYKNRVGKFAIPIIFFSPQNKTTKGINDSISTQQIDIMPSILDYLNYDKPFFAFGNSVFNPKTENFSVNYLSGIYQIIYGDYILLFDGQKTIALYNFKKDKLLKKNLVKSKKEIKIKLEEKIKIFIQNYNNRLINNKMTE